MLLITYDSPTYFLIRKVEFRFQIIYPINLLMTLTILFPSSEAWIINNYPATTCSSETNRKYMREGISHPMMGSTFKLFCLKYYIL